MTINHTQKKVSILKISHFNFWFQDCAFSLSNYYAIPLIPIKRRIFSQKPKNPDDECLRILF